MHNIKKMIEALYSLYLKHPQISIEMSSISKLCIFPVYIELNSSLPGFSYDHFSSPLGYDLRFLENNGSRELPYEPVMWNPQGVSSFWVLVSGFDQNTSLQAVWGNPNAVQQPSYCNDGSVWKNYQAVWHMDGNSDSTIFESRQSALPPDATDRTRTVFLDPPTRPPPPSFVDSKTSIVNKKAESSGSS